MSWFSRYSVTIGEVITKMTSGKWNKSVVRPLSVYELLVKKFAFFQTVPSNGCYPTEKLVKDNLDLKEVLVNKITAFQTVPDNTYYTSEKLAKDNLDLKEDTAHKSIAWQSLVDDNNYPSEKLFKDYMDLLVPSQAGNAGKFLMTNGSITSWVTPWYE